MHHRTGNKHWQNVVGLSALAIVLSCAALSQAPSSAPDASAPNANIQTERLTEPVATQKANLVYPMEEVEQNGEGWVELGLMVDPRGKPFQVTVVASSGDKVFEQAAVRAVERLTYKPGTLNGQPIESASRYKITFRFADPLGARPVFVNHYKKLMKAIAAKDKAAADAAMKDLDVKTLYEDAYFGFASYLYAREWGDETQQLIGLRRAIAFESTADYLPKAEFQWAQVQRLALEVKLKHYAEAQDLWSELLKSGIDSGVREKLAAAMKQVDDIRNSDRAYDVSGSLADGTWVLDLYKRNFRFKVSEGHISYVNLRCKKGFVRFAFDPDIQYNVNSKYGDCSMQLEGEVGTHFILTQF